MFDNQIFDSWLTKKSEEILSKVDRETISNEDMLILILKAQTNHFHHADVEFREEFKKIDERFDKVYQDIKKEFDQINGRFEMIEGRFEKIEGRFDIESAKVDVRFDKMWAFQKWQAGIILALFGGLYLKLFLG